MESAHLQTSRRVVLVGAGIGAAATVAACSTYGKEPAAESTKSSAAESTAPAPGAPPAALTKTAEVPVGSGVIVDDIVITQPTAGDFKGFSSVCPHRGCNVNEIVDGLIKCPCHGSEFSLDGAVAHGPATKPLTAKAIVVEGDSIVAG